MTNAVVLSVFTYVGLPLLAGLGAVLLRRRLCALLSGRRRAAADAEELRLRLREVLRAVPRRPPLLRGAPSHPLSLLVEARLLSGCPSQALSDTEQEVLQNPSDAGAFLALAKALAYSQKEDEARAALRWAQRLGADDAEFDYLRARLLAEGREALALCLRACRREPAYAEALYLCAQLARGLGFGDEGERLLRHIEPLMELSVERLSYFRDLHRLETLRRSPARRLLRRLSPRLVPSPAEGPAAPPAAEDQPAPL